VPATTGSTQRPRLAPTADDVFNRLQTRQVSWANHDLACPDNHDLIHTLEVRGPDNDLPDAIDAALGRADGLIVATPDLFASRVGRNDVVVWIEGSRLVAAFTSRCLV
jgi:hypothetical protein